MEEQVQAFLDYLIVAKKHTANTIAAYRNDMTQYLAYLHNPAPLPPVASWGELQVEHVVGYVLDLRARDYTRSTLARKIASLKTFHEFLYTTHVTAKNLAVSLDSPRVERNTPKSISAEQVQRLLAEPAKDRSPKGVRDSAMLVMLYATGMRVTELISLDLMDVNLVAGTVRCLGGGERARIIPYRRASRAGDPRLPGVRPAAARRRRR